MKRTSIIKNFSIFEIIIIALMAALGIASKPIVVPLAHMITAPLFIPGGVVAGGFYMLWIVLGAALVNKRGAATLIALTQSLMIMIMGSLGSHGPLSILTYTMPGLMVDACFIIFRRKITIPADFFVAGIIANLSGTYLTNLVYFRLPAIPLTMSLASGALSGGLGGILAYFISKKITDLGFDRYEGVN